VTAVAPRFRRAAEDDVASVLAMMREFYAEDGGHYVHVPAERALIALIADAALGAVWVAEDDTGACAYAVLTYGFSLEFHGRDAFLDEIYVRPRRRGQGLARAALQAVEAECAARGAGALHLEVTPTNEAALTLYRRLGFTLRGRQLMTRPVGGR
jgi:ribosomal protein S18 acetylase RimI-like enzyme